MGTKGKAKARKRDGIKDLAPRNAKQVKAGSVTLNDFSFVKKVDKASPTLSIG
jgi:type VI protein secretion system component Hcp